MSNLRKTIKTKLIERLMTDFNIDIDPSSVHTNRRSKYIEDIVCWFTVGNKKDVQSHLTMSQVVRAPKLLICEELGYLTIDLDLSVFKKQEAK